MPGNIKSIIVYCLPEILGNSCTLIILNWSGILLSSIIMIVCAIAIFNMGYWSAEAEDVCVFILYWVNPAGDTEESMDTIAAILPFVNSFIRKSLSFNKSGLSLSS